MALADGLAGAGWAFVADQPKAALPPLVAALGFDEPEGGT
jgi:hypothetical protein